MADQCVDNDSNEGGCIFTSLESAMPATGLSGQEESDEITSKYKWMVDDFVTKLRKNGAEAAKQVILKKTQEELIEMCKAASQLGNQMMLTMIYKRAREDRVLCDLIEMWEAQTAHCQEDTTRQSQSELTVTASVHNSHSGTVRIVESYEERPQSRRTDKSLNKQTGGGNTHGNNEACSPCSTFRIHPSVMHEFGVEVGDVSGQHRIAFVLDQDKNDTVENGEQSSTDGIHDNSTSGASGNVHEGTTVTEQDRYPGQGSRAQAHRGTKVYHNLMVEKFPRYLELRDGNTKDVSNLIADLKEEFKASGGRFLKQINLQKGEQARYSVMNDMEAHKTCGEAFRAEYRKWEKRVKRKLRTKKVTVAQVRSTYHQYHEQQRRNVFYSQQDKEQIPPPYEQGQLSNEV